MNNTFIALIPKEDHPNPFNAFRPIALCHRVDKIISKTLAVRLKRLLLSKCISSKQFGFLEGLQIHAAIGLAQERLNSMKIKNMPAMVLFNKSF